MSFLARKSVRALRIAVPLVVFAAGSAIHATDYFVDASQGTDRSQCRSSPGTGAAACRTIMYVVNGVVLRGGDTVHIAPGIYSEQVTITSADAGTSPTSLMTLQGAGKGQTVISGLSSVTLDDASAQQCTAALNCGGTGAAYPSTFRFDIGSRTVQNVFETRWTPFRVDDSSQTGVQYDFDKPVPYEPVSSVATVDGLSGSWYRSGNYLYVHTYGDVAPSTTANDLETSDRTYGVQINGANFVRVSEMTIRYADTLFSAANSDYVEVSDVEAYSGRTNGINFSAGSGNGTIRGVEVSNVQRRGEYSLPCSAGCGWVNGGSGNVIKIDGGAGVGQRGFLVENVVAYNGWNVVNAERTIDSTYRKVFAKNTPNHLFIMVGTSADADCTNNLIERSIAINGQDGFYMSGCTNGRLLRTAGGVGFYTEFGSATTGWRHLSALHPANAEWPISVANGSEGGWSSDNNWYPNSASRCNWMGSNRGCSLTGWGAACNCDANAIYAGSSVVLSGVTWPVGNGLAASRLRPEDFLPVAGSALIDRGDPDLDGDGTVENVPGGDDECTPSHGCIGAGPDIGPYELGLDDATGTNPNLPPPTNPRRTDAR